MELSINMVVIIMLGIAMLGIGISIFYKAINKTVELKENVDSQSQEQLKALLDDGSILAIPIKDVDGERGKLSMFSLGLTNIMAKETGFVIHVTYAGSSAYPDDSNDPFHPHDIGKYKFNYNLVCSNSEPEDCGDAWVKIKDRDFTLEPNERKFIPFGISVPKTKGVENGQYVFNVDVCIGEGAGKCYFNSPSQCGESDSCVITEESRYDARYQVIVTV